MSAKAAATLKIREMAQDERPREKLLARGATALTDPELIAILLRTGLPGANAVDVARQLLQRYNSLSGLSRCTVQEIAVIPGIDCDFLHRAPAQAGEGIVSLQELPCDVDRVGTGQPRSQENGDQLRIGQRRGAAREQLFARPLILGHLANL